MEKIVSTTHIKTKGYFWYMKERFINSLRFRNGLREGVCFQEADSNKLIEGKSFRKREALQIFRGRKV
jgi:hypothetical protein